MLRSLVGSEMCIRDRVWHENDLKGDFTNLHTGKGGGVHIGWNENFIVYAEMAFNAESGSQLYIDIGFLF